MSYSLNIEKNPEMIPAAIHVDNTCRPQSVSKDQNPGFYNLINQFYKITGVPAVLNTSFNRHGVATIQTPRQAIEHLLNGCVEILVMEDFIIFTDKKKDPRNYKVNFSKINKILNFKIKYTVDDGIKEMINFFKKNEKTLNMFNHLKFGNNVIDAEKL